MADYFNILADYLVVYKCYHLFFVFVYILSSVGLMQIFRKMGESGIRAWIPFYRLWILARRVEGKYRVIRYLIFTGSQILFAVLLFLGLVLLLSVVFVHWDTDVSDDFLLMIIVVNFIFCILMFISWVASLVFGWNIFKALVKHFQAPIWIALVMLVFPWLGFLILGFGTWISDKNCNKNQEMQIDKITRNNG